MSKYLIYIIYLIFISLGLPDSLLGSAWPQMHLDLDVPSSYAGYVSMTTVGISIISSLLSPYINRHFKEQWVVIVSIGLTCLGLVLFSFTKNYWNLFVFAIPYGLGAGSIDAAINNYVALHYSSRVMNFLHCFYGLGTMISPSTMALAIRFTMWQDGYRWTAYIQIAILVTVIASLPLWRDDNNEKKTEDKKKEGENNKDNKEEEKEEDKKDIEKSSDRIIALNENKKDIRLNPIKKKDNEIETKGELEKKDDKVTEKNDGENKGEKKKKFISLFEAIKIRGVAFSCLAYFTYCAGEGTFFLWTSSFFDGTKEGLSKDMTAALSTTVSGGLMQN